MKRRFRFPIIRYISSAKNQVMKHKSIHAVPLADLSADRVRKDIYSPGAKIDVTVKPVFTSRKLSQTLSVKENKPPIVNTQCVDTYSNVISAGFAKSRPTARRPEGPAAHGPLRPGGPVLIFHSFFVQR